MEVVEFPFVGVFVDDELVSIGHQGVLNQRGFRGSHFHENRVLNRVRLTAQYSCQLGALEFLGSSLPGN